MIHSGWNTCCLHILHTNILRTIYIFNSETIAAQFLGWIEDQVHTAEYNGG
jgi:hypothetical protein